jgi:hypothetical protein
MLKEKKYKMSDKSRLYHKLYSRKHEICNKFGQMIIGEKRVWPEGDKCELCKKAGHLGYHHYRDDNLKLGLYLCNQCHQMAEQVDKGLHKKYKLFRIIND